MGWFAIACVLGFLLYEAWRILPGTARRAATSVALATAIIIALSWVAAKQLFSEFVTDGIVARLLFGGVLGFGFAYVIAENRRAPSLTSRQRGMYFSIALALIVLAMAAPHLDTWLSRLSSAQELLEE
jgi:hypothetical protein